MNRLSSSDSLPEAHQKAIAELERAIAWSQGEFSIILARCNSDRLRHTLIQRLRQRGEIEFSQYCLNPSTIWLFSTLHEQFPDRIPPAVMVCEFETVRNLDRLLANANMIREEFRKHFTCPMVWWVSDTTLSRMIRIAPDFFSWTTSVQFQLGTEEVTALVESVVADVFDKLLDAGALRFCDRAELHLEAESPRRSEFEVACKTLQQRGVTLDPGLAASLEFVRGLLAPTSQQSRECYDRAIEKFPTDRLLERQGGVLFYLGWWWRFEAERDRLHSEEAYGKAKDYYQRAIATFDRAERPDLAAKFINPLGEIWQWLGEWEALEAVAQRATALHRHYPNPIWEAHDRGILRAEIEIARSQWERVAQLAREALQILDSAGDSAALQWSRAYHRGWILLSLSRAQVQLGASGEAIDHLNEARSHTDPAYDPSLYVRILTQLHDLYFQNRQYLAALETKQEQRAIEYQFGFRAFLGVMRLRPRLTVLNPAAQPTDERRMAGREIAASGRQEDIRRLRDRIGRHDCRLTIIHGQSGVGKSSLLQAGLIPALQQQPIGCNDVVPVLQQVYPNWVSVLGDRLGVALGEPPLDSIGSICDRLGRTAEENRLIVLIFDQFEEFFFTCKQPEQRREFYEFLKTGLNIEGVRVILSLREDYLHYLLECNRRLVDLDVVSNDILNKNWLYYLGNFSKEDAKSVIGSLTDSTAFALEEALVEQLVEDLAQELGCVRPIELQVVGAQLQAERIHALADYRTIGDKRELVERHLLEIIRDCGKENEQTAQLVLYLLTDEDRTRPLKTKAELAEELGSQARRLESVLPLLIESRLVVRLSDPKGDRYQLVHDYFVPFVRAQRSADILGELERARTLQQQSDRKFNRILKVLLAGSISAACILAGTTFVAVRFGLQVQAEKERAQQFQQKNESIST